MSTGIYKIQNLINGKCYVGQAANIESRWHRHKTELKNFKHTPKFQNAYNKHGIYAFEYSILELCGVDKLDEREQYWMDSLDSIKNGYNIQPVAGTCRGQKLSEETKKKIGDSHRGKHYHTLESKEKIRQARKGNQYNKGRKHSEESLKRMSDAAKGRVLLDSTKEKLSIFNKGKTLSEETKRKISDAGKGRICTEGTKKKISERLVKAWEKRKLTNKDVYGNP